MLITITLLAFLVLLLVSLASLTRVETQVASNSQKLSEARQNALLALNLALGHLQQAAGPDLRLTSRADLAAAGQNAPFTGIWKPGDAAPSTWLVSGNQLAAAPLAVTPATAPSPIGGTGADEVWLLGDASVAAAADRVKLTRQAILVPGDTVPGLGSGSPVTVGHFAYWVGDEGVKASAALNDQTDELDYDNRSIASPPANSPTTGADWSVDTHLRTQLRQLTPAHPNLAELFPNYVTTPALNALQPRAVNYGQLAFLDAANLTRDELRTRFHDATTVSRAVLVDHAVAPNGGLRKDISDSPDVFPSAIRNFVKERAASHAGLQAYHAQKASENGADTAFPMFSKGPVLTEFLIRFQFSRDAGTGNIRLKYEVQAELWNPYAFTLNAATDLRIRLSGLPVVTVTSEADGVPHPVDLNTTAALNGSVDSTISWTPGQIRWVKGAGGSSLSYSETGAARSVAIATTPPVPAGSPLTISIPAVPSGTAGRFKVEVTRGGTALLATYLPLIDFQAATATNDTPDLNNAGWHFGYAYDFRDDLRDWTDPTRTTSQDPRRTNLDGTFFESADSAWSALPTDNIGEINRSGTDTFNEQNPRGLSPARPLVLFDLSRQEAVSVGSLQHVIGEKPYRLGNPATAPLATVNDYFDRYYFSTLPRWHAWTAAAPPVLPNRYIEVHVPDPANPPPVGDRYGATSTGATADYLLDYHHAAKYLLLRGAFNINSTSEAAWRAVLSGLQFPSWNYGGATVRTTALDNAFFRLSQGAQELATDPGDAPDADNTFARGVLTITDSQLAAMAASIVGQLKTRGRPYATLRDFVDDGVIATAIADAGINSADPDDVPPYSPGWLSQADVLTALAPFITPRSDTFRIRAYGDTRNPVTGETAGRAWCEAFVQRVPSLTAPATGTLVPATDPLTPSAAKFPLGRQFKITSFRWLSSTDL